MFGYGPVMVVVVCCFIRAHFSASVGESTLQAAARQPREKLQRLEEDGASRGRSDCKELWRTSVEMNCEQWQRQRGGQ